MNRVSFAIIVIGLTAVMSGSATAATLPRIPLETLIARSEHIVYARVVASRSVWDPQTRTIWTETELRVMESAKGTSAGSLVVSEPGGVLGDVGHVFPGVPQFRLDEEVVVFLYRAGNRLRVTGLGGGMYTVTRDGPTHVPVARPSASKSEAVFERGGPAFSRGGTADEAHRVDEFLYGIRQRVR